jgi:DNA-directed RNA polymerase subunit M/transcription elongation factor TFIIS
MEAKLRGYLEQTSDLEIMYLAAMYDAEPNPQYKAAFDAAVERKADSYELMWTLSSLNAAKVQVVNQLKEARGMGESFASGAVCPACGERETTMRAVQLNAGDEATKLEIRCLNKRCGSIQYVS